MITHRRNPYITSWFCHHARSLIRKNFYKCSLTPTSQLPEFESGVPTLAICNHSSWWDAMLALYMAHFYFKTEFYGVFDEEQLKRYGIFRSVGCYSVNRSDKHETLRFLRYTQQLLAGQSRLLWIFPQGDLISNAMQLNLKRGFAQIASTLPKVQLLKMVVSYDFWLESKPEIVVDLMPLETIAPVRGKGFVNDLTERVTQEMQLRVDEVGRIVRERDNHLKPLMRISHGTNVVYDAYRETKALLTGRRFSKNHGVN